MVQLASNPLGHIGPKWHRPVILPLPRAGGGRCSVKPASRGTLHFRNRRPQTFEGDPRPSSQLGTGRPVNSHYGPNPMS
ncbi:hypothetical protein Ddye_014204 [Dipteronia dyeriana]|uniref:Uncharacterized protein n=1 Tax=Dipteronia dyeriana TaxID=168575 RepID=A0AAD9X7W1_9ROSI|nr:hypothetical protein Ddye_014204 [Dipteronia dyeriana]